MCTEPEEMVACFRCGQVNPETEQDEESGLLKCRACGETGVMTFQLALDIINDMFLKEIFLPKKCELYDDNTMDYEYDLDELK